MRTLRNWLSKVKKSGSKSSKRRTRLLKLNQMPSSTIMMINHGKMKSLRDSEKEKNQDKTKHPQLNTLVTALKNKV